jgi:hypothetical protein
MERAKMVEPGMRREDQNAYALLVPLVYVPAQGLSIIVLTIAFQEEHLRTSYSSAYLPGGSKAPPMLPHGKFDGRYPRAPVRR